MIIGVAAIYELMYVDVILFHVLQLLVLQKETSTYLILKFEHYPNLVTVIISVRFFLLIPQLNI